MGLSPLQSFLLGIVQGLTEFLPISSSAHLILLPRLAGWPDGGLAYDVALHLGTLTGVVVYFFKDLARLVGSWLAYGDPSRQAERNLVVFLVLASVPAAVVGLLLENLAETLFRSPELVAWALIAGGVALAMADYFALHTRPLQGMTALRALGIGVAQSLALIPGISRSGATITAALAMGFERAAAARFSFLLSIPVIGGAGLFKLQDIWNQPDHKVLAAGFAGAALSGFLAIWILLRYVQKHRFTPFVLYRLALGAAILLYFKNA